MGDLIVMTRPTKASRRSTSATAGSAEILFFTGVRYLRITDYDMPYSSEPHYRPEIAAPVPEAATHELRC